VSIADVTDWIDEFSRSDSIWYVKRLAANDTLASGGHQAGPYVPKGFLFELFPELNQPEAINPDIHFELFIDSHITDVSHREIRAVWYNNKLRNGTRDESRLTGFGGIRSALLDPDNTGALSVFAFKKIDDKFGWECHVWVCDDSTHEDLFEERIGTVEPKTYVIWRPGISKPENDLFSATRTAHSSCWLTRDKIPNDWLIKFPTGKEIIQQTIKLRPETGTNPDVRLLRRRDCEFEIFRSVEQEFYIHKISSGFSNMESFIGLANTILQSRKSRSGKSLEYHAIEILLEEGFFPEQDFSYNPLINGKRPDFVFPSTDAYKDTRFNSSNLRMLAIKTTCKDRWRQILNEVDKDRIPTKHLLTLQEGVSQNQFNEMLDEGVQLVVPFGLHKSYPKKVRPHLMTLESFLADIRLLALKKS